MGEADRARGPVAVPPEPLVSRAINRELVTIAGWGRAILLQLAHPLVAAGVAEHSSFRSGPFASLGRLHGTIGAMIDLTFGSPEDIRRTAGRINAIHDRVHGTLAVPAGLFPAGTRYSAHDAELLRWVHATLLESLPLIYGLFVRPLDLQEQDRFCRESMMIGPLLGIPDDLLPRSQVQVRDYIRQRIDDGEVQVTETARQLARVVLSPRWSVCVWPAFRILRLATIGLLPDRIRSGYGFAWDDRSERALERWGRLSRVLHRLLPGPLHQWPAARRAERRGASARPGPGKIARSERRTS